MPNTRVPAAIATTSLPTLEQPWQAAAIDASHMRCAQFGLAPSITPDFSGPALDAWRCALEQSEHLRHNAIPIMGMLYQQITRSRSMVVLTDDEGLILETVGDDEFLESAQKVALANGVKWSESEKGTNAIGTAIADDAPTLVHGRQHYLKVNHFLTCSAAPIHGPAGEVVGVLDVTGNERSYHQHTMALVNMSTTMIENNLVGAALTSGLRISFHRRPEFLSTLAEAIVCVDADGCVTGTNSVARREYGIASDPRGVSSLTDFFGLSVNGLIDLAGTDTHQPVRLYVQEDTAVFARIEFHGQAVRRFVPVSSSASNAVPQVQGASRPESTDPFARLDTGDKSVHRVIGRLRRVIDHDMPLLFGGPNGVGKRSFAEAMHQASRRHDKQLAFISGAAPVSNDPAQWFEPVAPGTVVLCDVQELAPPLQAALATYLRTPRFQTLGVRLMCTTAVLAASDQLRHDLYHQINGLAVSLPSLTERTDLDALIQAILAELEPSPNPVSEAVQGLLRDSRWPGNIRQLRQLLVSSSALAGPGVEIRLEHLPEDFIAAQASSDVSSASSGTTADLKSVTDSVIERVLQEHGGNVSSAARQLGVSRNTIYRHRRKAGQ